MINMIERRVMKWTDTQRQTDHEEPQKGACLAHIVQVN